MLERIHKGCGGMIQSIVLTSYPPIYVEQCSKCGKELSRVRDEIKREEIEF